MKFQKFEQSILLLSALMLLSGCASQPSRDAAMVADRVETKATKAVGEAARTPFSDLNLVRRYLDGVRGGGWS